MGTLWLDIKTSTITLFRIPILSSSRGHVTTKFQPHDLESTVCQSVAPTAPLQSSPSPHPSTLSFRFPVSGLPDRRLHPAHPRFGGGGGSSPSPPNSLPPARPSIVLLPFWTCAASSPSRPLSPIRISPSASPMLPAAASRCLFLQRFPLPAGQP
ncbi:unnamed protein product [Urochloa humidicola]